MKYTFYVWASSLDKAIIELHRGNWLNTKEAAKACRCTIDQVLWEIKFTRRKSDGNN